MTGAIATDGKVQGVGGAHLKTRAVEADERIGLFLVPEENAKEAKPRRSSLQVAPVTSLADAVKVLAERYGRA